MKIRHFGLSDKFIENYINREVPWGPVGYITYKRTYSRRIEETGESEEWYQTCRRVIEGMFDMQKQHCNNSGLPWDDAKAQRTAKDAYERLFTLKWTPPGRGLWMAGTRFVREKTGSGLFNCAFASTKDLATKGGYIFRWMMDSLMLGIGVGFDTLGANTLVIKKPGDEDEYSSASDSVNEFTKINGVNYCIIADSREGWAESVEVLIDAYLQGTILPVFIYDKIRLAGTVIKGFGGTSSGPGPLIELHESLIELYSAQIGQPISSSTIVSTENLIGRCVVSGNVRRSAALAMGQANDMEFLKLKDPTELYKLEAELASLPRMPAPVYVMGNYEETEYAQQEKYKQELKNQINSHPLRHHRWGSNNSIEAKVGMDYSAHAKSCVANGEPGFIWLENARTRGRFKDPMRYDDLKVMGFNPCSEQQLEDKELCCLVETYPWLHETYEDWQQTLKIAYLYAKTVTLAKTDWPETNAIMLKNRRIGLSISGFEQAANKFGNRTMYDWCDKAYEYVQRLDAVYSDWLCIPKSKRTTSIKPSGTVSLLNGSTPGMHWPIAQWAIRRIVFANTDPLIPQLEKAGYHIEPSAYYPDSSVVEFPIETPYFSRSEASVSMWEQLERAAQLMYYWADNSVSATVKFHKHEAQDIENALKLYETRLKAISFLSDENPGYVQMPFEPITEEQYLARKANLIPINRLSANQGVGEAYCDGDKCIIIPGKK